MKLNHSFLNTDRSIESSAFFVIKHFGKPLLSVLLLAALSGALMPTKAHALSVARVRNLKPMVQIKGKGAASFIMARDRNALRFGDTVRTLDKGKADLLFANGTQLALKENTQIEIVAPETPSNPLVIRVFGALSEVFVRPKGNTQIRTAAAIAAARGTQYLVSLPTEDSTVVTVTEGSVDFYNKEGTVLVQADQQSRARIGSAPTAPVATDVTGLVTWTADITGLPVEFEMPFVSNNAGELAAALKQRQAQVAAQPGSAAARRQLGEVLVDLDQPNEALVQFEQAGKLTTDAAETAAILAGTARAQQLRGDTPAAIGTYRQALQSTPNERNIQLRLALAQLSARDFEGARASLPAESAARGENAVTQTVGGLIALHQGRSAEAEAQLRAAIQNDPTYGPAHSLLALSLLTQNRVPDAEESARAAVGLQPNSAQTQGVLATVLLFTGDTKEAARAADRAVAINPESPFALLAQGRIALSRLNTDEARTSLQQAQALAPDLPVIPNELGAVYLRLDMLPKAEKAYQRAIELSPNYADAYNGLGLVLQRQGKPTEAEAQFRRALQIDANNGAARSNIATLYIEQGRLADAETELQIATTADPQRGIVYVRLSELSLLRNDLYNAQQFARRAVSLLPASAVAHYQLGRVYLEQQRSAQAEQEFRQAVYLDRHFAAARFALGYTQDIVQQGRDSARIAPTNNSSSLGTASNALDVQNLQTPGASERIKAAIADPTVVRVATRSYGDTQIEGAIGDKNRNDLSVSHLQEGSNRRSVFGVTGEYHRNDGRLTNDTVTNEQASLVFGKKARNNPSAIFGLAQYNRIKEGLNYDGSDAFLANGTQKVEKPLFLVGANFQKNDRSSTRALLQYISPTSESRGLGSNSTRDGDLKSFNGEVRHDIRLGEKHLLNIGLFGGSRKGNESAFRGGIPTVIQFSDNDATLYGAYLRDEIQVNSRLRATAELRVQHLKQDGRFRVVSPIVFSSANRFDNTEYLPTLLLEYQLNQRTGIRLRARRLAGTFEDFQLLAPTDPFYTLDNLPRPAINDGAGNSIELEGNHTFKNASFLRTGLVFQRLRNAQEPFIGGSGFTIPKVSVVGAKIGYEGNLSDKTTYFVNLNFNRVHDKSANEAVAESPSFVSEVGLQYLSPRGLFVQPTFLYQSGRYNSLAGGATERNYTGGLGLFNVRVGKRAGVRSTVYVEVLNAFDKQYDAFGINRIGRQYRVGAMRRF